MLITIKRPHNIVDDRLINFLKEGNKIKRLSFNWFKKNSGGKVSECEQYIKSLNNIKLDASWIKSLVNMTKNIDNNKSVLFGDRKLFNKLTNKDYKTEIERIELKKQFKLSKNKHQLLMRGSSSDSNSNRKGKLELINDILKVQFKIDKNNYFDIELDLKRNQLKDIKRLIELNDSKKGYFNIGIDDKNIFIQYDNKLISEDVKHLKQNRVMGIDLNPYEIGLVILDNNKLIYKEVIGIEKLVKLRSAYKTDNELSCIGEYIVKLCKHYRCGYLVIEDLNLKNSSVKLFNEWNKNDIVNSLNKWTDYFNIKFCPKPAYYSTFIGQFNNPSLPDCLASAIEMALRYKLTSKEINKRIESFLDKKIYINSLPNRWKEEVLKGKSLFNDVVSFRSIYLFLKSNQSRYYRVRVRFNEVNNINFIEHSLKSIKSLTKVFKPVV
jgi:hypothetical protein